MFEPYRGARRRCTLQTDQLWSTPVQHRPPEHSSGSTGGIAPDLNPSSCPPWSPQAFDGDKRETWPAGPRLPHLAQPSAGGLGPPPPPGAPPPPCPPPPPPPRRRRRRPRRGCPPPRPSPCCRGSP